LAAVPELSHLHGPKDGGKAAEVIRMRMREHHHVDPRAPCATEHRQDDALTRIDRISDHTAPVHEVERAVRQLEKTRVALPHVERSHAQDARLDPVSAHR
jgi:hypothetical protein